MSEHPPAVVMAHITKRFGVRTANEDVCLTVLSGSIHGIVGENGAGKSTIMKILYGLLKPDEGTVEVFGKPASIQRPEQAIEMGLGMVHQHFMLVDSLTVLENIILGHEPTRARFFIDRESACARIRGIMDESGMELDLHARVGSLSVGEKQSVELLKILFRNASVLILDEPTAVLTPQETEKLFKVLRKLKQKGKTLIVISHKLPEIMALTDRVSVFRKGKNVADHDTAEVSEKILATEMIGRPLEDIYLKSAYQDQPCLLQLSDVCYTDEDSGIQKLKHINLKVHKREIVGLAGVSGNGQRELERIIASLDTLDSGSIERTYGTMSHIPEDRQESGLVMEWAMAQNILLGYQGEKTFRKGPFIDFTKLKETARSFIETYRIEPPSTDLPLKFFSGGNQQKVVVAREVLRQPEFVLVSQPTRGVDIGAMEFIHQVFLNLRDSGAGLLLISADLQELLNLSDRILVLCKGRIVGELDPKKTTQEAIGLMMSGASSA